MIDIQADDIVFLAEPHEYIVRGKRVPSVTQTIEAAGMGENFFLVPPDVLKMAQQRGNAVHIACAYIDSGELDLGSVDERIMGYVQAYAKFRRECLVKTIAVEEKMSGEVPFGHVMKRMLAGTPDLIGFINGRRSIIDLKTGQVSGTALQTAGYKLLWDSSHPTAPIYDRYSLKLNKDGTYRLRPESDPDDIPAFLDALEYATAKAKADKWLEKYSKR